MKKTSAKVRREMARVEVARELSKARTYAEIEQQEIAQACGVARQVPSVWEHRDGVKSPWLVDVALMPTEVATPLIRWVANQHGYRVTATSGDTLDVACMSSLHAVLKECADVTTRHSAALADGELSPSELAEIEREALEAADALAKLAASARARLSRHVSAARSRLEVAR